MKSIPKIFLIVAFCFLLTGCASEIDDTPLLPNLGIQDSLLNKDLRVTAPAVWNNFNKKEDWITLEITLVTNKQIITNPDFNAEIYLYDDTKKEWKKIKNLGNYETPPDKIILHQGDIEDLSVLPELSNTPASQSKVLIFVSGNVVEKGHTTNKVIGTHIILHLKP